MPKTDPPGTVTIHQLDAKGACWREFDHHPATEDARQALYARIERGYLMTRTMVTRDGEYEFGTHGDHPDPPASPGRPQGTPRVAPSAAGTVTAGDDRPVIAEVPDAHAWSTR
ncbi:MAG TPA: hypothetical protein VJT31_35075 [Rugosimonospora sp.]|nr:hypothetical protein [Rugosimonospora sp.]